MNMNMINDSFIDDIITNLKIIGLIEPNNKLSIKNGHLKLDKLDNLQFIRRWLNRDSREHTIIFLKNIIKNVSELTHRLDNFTENDKNWVLKRIVSELEGVEIGIKNLKTTYIDDSFIIVNLDNILCKLKEIVKTHNKNDTIIPIPIPIPNILPIDIKNKNIQSAAVLVPDTDQKNQILLSSSLLSKSIVDGKKNVNRENI